MSLIMARIEELGFGEISFRFQMQTKYNQCPFQTPVFFILLSGYKDRDFTIKLWRC